MPRLVLALPWVSDGALGGRRVARLNWHQSQVAATLVRRSSAARPSVTSREVQVLELLARGMSNKEIAKELFVSEGTVKSHLAHIYAKLDTDTRAGAVAAAIDRRVIRARTR